MRAFIITEAELDELSSLDLGSPSEVETGIQIVKAVKEREIKFGQAVSELATQPPAAE